MTVRRACWVMLSPIVWAAHRFGWCSYTWVNVCHGARRPDRFDALWQHRWYGAPVTALPDQVILGGTGYRTAVSEGTVTFVEEFTRGRITFDRDPHDRLADLWYLTLSRHAHAATHVDAAYAWVRAVFGGSFERRAIPIRAEEGQAR
jgi:hypothetical protein